MASSAIHLREVGVASLYVEGAAFLLGIYRLAASRLRGRLASRSSRTP